MERVFENRGEVLVDVGSKKCPSEDKLLFSPVDIREWLQIVGTGYHAVRYGISSLRFGLQL